MLNGVRHGKQQTNLKFLFRCSVGSGSAFVVCPPAGEAGEVGEDEEVSEVQTPRTADHEETDSNPVSLRDEFTGNEVCHSDVKTPSLSVRTVRLQVGAATNCFGPLHPTNDTDE